MGFDFQDAVYEPCFALFARPIMVWPIASDPGELPYPARGILHSMNTDVIATDGSIFSDAKTVLDIIINEFEVIPNQHDIISIMPDANVNGGIFEISDMDGSRALGNTGGMLSFILKTVTPIPLDTDDYFVASPDFDEPALAP